MHTTTNEENKFSNDGINYNSREWIERILIRINWDVCELSVNICLQFFQDFSGKTIEK